MYSYVNICMFIHASVSNDIVDTPRTDNEIENA